ncbi:PTS mannose/fructose/sorbose/N-acetylgalactosamine transporter subunit IIC [Holdemania filiformis]|uniref:PTS mannose/fructose/sorbose/N-acetylgalactosamine transporter subunit IIC n=1 Tax=Holdemania filiformis TaxID=61171 RepID=UPI0022E74441|nr:PTS sugar transporter subunit IIC [Holdemania filiformis]
MDVSISLFQAFLMGVVYYLGIIGTPWTTVLGSASLFQKPLVAGTLVGLILGRPAEGVIIGAAIQLPYIAFISAGGTIPSDPGLAGVLGTAFAIVGNVDPATAITIAIPFGLLGTVVWVLHMTIDVAFVHMADKAAEQGDLKKVCFLHVVPPQIVAFAISVIPVMLGAYFGADYMARLVAMLSNDVLHVLQVIGGVLPALGVAMNLRSISRPNSMAFYMLGFILSVYLGLDTIVIAVLGFIIAWFYTQLQKENG